jgi:calcineurin-like phosphoesterase family protein
MYKTLKFSYTEKHKHFWSSDLHNFHNPNWEIPIWKQRGYRSYQESYIDVSNKINTRVGPDDHLWLLGDSFLSCNDTDVMNWFSGIVCQNIHMLFGNHESQVYRIYKSHVMSQYGSDEIEVYPLRVGNLIFSGNHQEISIGKQVIVMNHFPLHSHNKAARSSWNLSGHSHRTDGTRGPAHPTGKRLDVGWDRKLDVWSYDEILDVMSTKEIYSPDHH